MNSYQQLLRDPRWQRKRLEIMQRDGWKCSHCSDDKSELNVHHKEYRKGHKPWEYPNELLVTLCRSCHERQHTTDIIPYVAPAVSFLSIRGEKIKGVVINWTDEKEAGFSLYDFIPWTGGKERENDPNHDEIYICVDKNGNEFRIDASFARAFKFPKNIEVDQETFQRYDIDPPPSDMLAWLIMVRDLVREGARDFT